MKEAEQIGVRQPKMTEGGNKMKKIFNIISEGFLIFAGVLTGILFAYSAEEDSIIMNTPPIIFIIGIAGLIGTGILLRLAARQMP